MIRAGIDDGADVTLGIPIPAPTEPLIPAGEREIGGTVAGWRADPMYLGDRRHPGEDVTHSPAESLADLSGAVDRREDGDPVWNGADMRAADPGR